MTVRSNFLFIGSHPAVDFLNTEYIHGGEPVDALGSPAALARWLEEAKLTSSVPVRVTPAIFAGVKRLRAALRSVVGAMADGKKPDPKSVKDLDRELARGAGSLALRLEGTKFVFGFEPSESARDDPRFLIAYAAAEFLAGADRSRVRRCQGSQCILLYYDVTKSGTRRWCSMAGCGNRQKAAAHYARISGRSR